MLQVIWPPFNIRHDQLNQTYANDFAMAITENQAQRVLWVRALEQSAHNDQIWSAQDAQAATRATKNITGENSPFDLFVASRAEYVIEQIAKRNPELVTEPSRRQSLAVFGWALIVAAFAIGFMTDHLMADRWVNVIEWPIVLLIAWNLFVVTYNVGQYVWSFFRPATDPRHVWLNNILGRWQRWGMLRFNSRKKSSTWVKSFEIQWQQNCITLNTLRISLVFHAASIAFAIGMLGSLYVRGLFKAYRVGWESTFLSADAIHALASVVLAPGAWLFNMEIPSVEQVAGLQMPNGREELAANWIHLYAGSILLCVIVPRLVLLIKAGYSKVCMQRNFPLPLSSMYYTALRSLRAGFQATVLTIPFRYELTSVMKANLTRLLECAHGLSSTVSLEQAVVMGHDVNDWKSAFHREGYIAVFVIFNLNATAEQDTHGRLMRNILKECRGLAPVIPIVDTSPYSHQNADLNTNQNTNQNTHHNAHQNNQQNKLRFDQRCHQWRTVLNTVGCTPLFLDLLTLDQEDAQDSVATQLYAYN